MKKFFLMFTSTLLLVCLLCACASNEKPQESTSSDISNSNSDVANTNSDVANADTEEIDVDLTQLSSTMIFAEVSHMMMSPEEYVGKTVKMSGEYYASYYEHTDKHYHFVIIADAEACCQEGMEFILVDDHDGTDSYPTDGEKVEICGKFSSYIEMGRTYYHIKTNDIKIV